VAAIAFAVSISVSDTVSAAPAAVGSCPRPADAATLPERRAGGVLRGDIDGDGVRDRVSIRYAPRARASCGFFLVVATRGRTLSVRVPEWYKPPQDLPVSKWPFAEPFVAVIVRLNAHRSQVVVAREHGAAVVNISRYGVFRGELELIHFPAPRRDLGAAPCGRAHPCYEQLRPDPTPPLGFLRGLFRYAGSDPTRHP
jgi:hypothetical protein